MEYVFYVCVLACTWNQYDHSRLFWTSWFWCRFAEPVGYIHSLFLRQLLLMALLIHFLRVCVQNGTSFMNSSSCFASVRLMLLPTCSNSRCNKQPTRSIIGYTYSSPRNANTALSTGAKNRIKWTRGWLRIRKVKVLALLAPSSWVNQKQCGRTWNSSQL